MRRLLCSVFAVLCFATVSAAHAELVIASGAPQGTYHAMISEVIKACEAPAIRDEPSSGSQETIAKLLGNKINCGVVQVDALALRQMNDNQVNQLRTLVALHPEEVHIVVPATATITVGGRHMLNMTVGGTNVLLTSLEQLAGKKVGAWGGSAITAQVIQLQTGVPYTLVEFESKDATLNALKTGVIDAVLAVGGQPLKWLEEAPRGTYRLLAVPDTLREKVKQVYKSATLYYRNLEAEGLPTIATSALLVTRDYKSGTKVAELNELRACIIENLPMFQEEVGYHPKWQTVDPNDQGRVIPYFSTTSASVAPPAPPKR